MTVGLSTSGYNVYQKPGYTKKWTSQTLKGSIATTEYVSQYNNICTDGSDDGQIGLGSKIGCVGKGVLQTGKNIIKGVVEHPFKSALMIGASFIPVVGPLVIAGTAAYGLYSGAKTVMNGIQTANAATNDAQAKDAWENIGVGGSTAAVSAVALKGATGALRNQLSGGSSTVNTYREYKAGKAEFSDVLKEGINEAGNNIKSVVDSVKQKFDSIKEKGVSNYLKEKVDSLTEKSKEFVDKHSKNAKADAKQAKAETKQNIEDTIKDLQAKGAKKSGFGYRLKEGNVTTKYNSKGELFSKETFEDGIVTTETFKNGEVAARTTETLTVGKGKMVKTEKFGNGGISTSSNKTWDPKGKFIKTSKYFTDNGTCYTAKELSNLQMLDINYRNSNLGLGDTVQFGKVTMPFNRVQAYEFGKFTLPATFVEEN